MEDIIEQSTETEAQAVRLGRSLVSWETDEYPRYARSKRWYIIASVIAAACIIYAVATANFLFAVIVLMFGVITLIGQFQEPGRIEIVVTTTGIVIGDSYYAYKGVKDFSIIYDPPIKMLYVAFQTAWQPMLAIPLEDTDPNVLRESLLPYCIENLARSEERLTDVFRRVYKL
jgi:hypothetical protein